MLVRVAVQIAFGIIGLVFLAIAIAFGHVAVWYAFRLDFGWAQPVAGAVLTGIDLFIALIVVLIASRMGPGRVEREALDVRKRAITGATSTMAISAALLPVMRLVVNLSRGRRAD